MDSDDQLVDVVSDEWSAGRDAATATAATAATVTTTITRKEELVDPEEEEEITASAEEESKQVLASAGADLKKKFHLSLDNFDSEDIPEDCPYVLTSPRSLEACKRLRVKVRLTKIDKRIDSLVLREKNKAFQKKIFSKLLC